MGACAFKSMKINLAISKIPINPTKGAGVSWRKQKKDFSTLVTNNPSVVILFTFWS